MVGEEVHRYQKYGVILALGFAILLINDSGSSKRNTSTTSIVFGDLLALLVSPISAFYYILNASNVALLPSMVVYTVLNIVNLVMLVPVVLGYLYSQNSQQLFFTTDEQHGAFGWYSDRYFYQSVLLLGPIAGLLGSGSYIYMLSYFSPEITATIFLLEPVIAQILGVVFG